MCIAERAGTYVRLVLFAATVFALQGLTIVSIVAPVAINVTSHAVERNVRISLVIGTTAGTADIGVTKMKSVLRVNVLRKFCLFRLSL